MPTIDINGPVILDAYNIVRVVLPALIQHGIGLEAHSQNMVARFALKEHRLVGFASRDFGGMKLHMPTERQLAPELATAALDAHHTRERPEDVYQSVYSSIFRGHLAQFLHALGLHGAGGWAVVREELDGVVNDMNHSRAVELRDFLTAERLPVPCHLRTKLDPCICGECVLTARQSAPLVELYMLTMCPCSMLVN